MGHLDLFLGCRQGSLHFFKGSVHSCVFCDFFFFFFFGAAVYGGSQARNGIGAAAASLHHSMAMPDLSLIRDLYHSLQLCWILNPLREARD